MPKFSTKSEEKLATCHPDLQTLFRAVVLHRDCTIVEGHRGKIAQDTAYAAGRSRRPWPKGEHNAVPSRAVDALPFVNGRICDTEAECRAFGGFVMGVAAMLSISVRWGGDWDGDGDSHDQSLHDLCHFELC